jgi:tetratricopeptide (TPR) repeat protein
MTIVALVALFVLRDRIGRGPVVAALFFVGSLVPALGFFTVYPQRFSFVADHFQYLACIGVIALVVAIFHNQTRSTLAMRVLSGLAILALSFTTWQRTRAFEDLKSLWTDTIEKNPAAWMAYNNLGSLLLAEGKVDDAAKALQSAVDLKPDHGDAIAGLGRIALRNGDFAGAEQKFRESLRVAPPGSPTAANAHAYLANVYASTNRFDDAIREYQQAIALEPRSGDWIDELGMIYFTQGKIDQAIECFERMRQLDPNSFAANMNLGHAMSRLGRSRDALEYWSIALKQRPNDFQLINSMGAAYLRLGRRDLAIQHFRRALEINPNYEVAKKNLQAIGAN